MFGIIPISPNEERSRNLILLFRIFMAILVVCTIVEFGTTAAFGDTSGFPGAKLRLFLVGGALLSIVRAICYILLVVFFIMWMRRAYHNLHKAGSRHLRHSEGWAAGAWFVPFLNLAWPLQIMRDIWQETQAVFRRQDEVFERQEDNVTGWWWAMFLVSGFVTEIGALLLRNKDFETGYLFGGIGSLGYILTAFMAIGMIKRISAMETQMMERAHLHYAWLNQQQAQNFREQNPGQMQSRQQENFYRPDDNSTPPHS